jgi:hypothetical protein
MFSKNRIGFVCIYINSGERAVSGIMTGIMRGDRGCRENAESNDQIPGKQTLESWNPGTLSPD